MSQVSALVGLNIDSPLVTPQGSNFLPPSWPPPDDFPVVIDAQGKVVSRYGEPIWDLSPWAGEAMKLNFGDGKLRKGDPGITPFNASLFRQVVALWLYGPNSVRVANTLILRFTILRPLFVTCSKGPSPVRVSDLMRYPKVAERVAAAMQPSQSSYALTLLHDLWEQREALGFVLLDATGLKDLAAALPNHETAQTPYIPPRIWLYQVNRLRAFLDDFLKHGQKIEECYRFCLEAYAQNAGSLGKACSERLHCSRHPFNHGNSHRNGKRPGCTFYGRFSITAEKFGIKDLLERWMIKPGETLDSSEAGIQALSSYFTLVGYAGTAYLLNFSMMRIDEVWALQADCLTVERDEVGDDIYMLSGPTTKTIQDGDARWITSPSAKVAVEAMVTVTNLRMLAADANPDVPTTPEDIRNPHLVERSYEPWAVSVGPVPQPLTVRPLFDHYKRAVSERLFDPEELRITASDLEAARLVTPTLDPVRFDVGKVWPLAWHQLRRTGAVNMVASGIVGDASVQHQLKHATRSMSRYYGQGYYHLQLRLNESARNEYVRTMYEVIAREFSQLGFDRFVSPYGEQRKAQILNVVSAKDSKAMVAAAKAGKLPTGSICWVAVQIQIRALSEVSTASLPAEATGSPASTSCMTRARYPSSVSLAG
ncbi:MAG TPA: hypothetical protein VIL60_01755 [Rhodanobacter sp.]